MKLAGLHFEGRASVLFRFYQASKGLVAWKLFTADVIAKFKNPEGKDVQELFNKLKQTSSVAEYEDRFEELRAMVLYNNRGFTEEYFVSSFLSGLKEHIKASVRLFRPQTLSDIVFLAKQEEAKGYKSQVPYKPSVPTTTNSPPPLSKSESKPYSSTTKVTGKEFPRS